MPNQVILTVTFEDNKRVNNMVIPVMSLGSVNVNLDRKFLANLEKYTLAFKELGKVGFSFGKNPIAVLENDGYTFYGKEKVTFQRFGGKIAKDFFNEIDDRVSELESEESEEK